jgi:nicotinate-nucleotide adenylyltransferase
VSPARVRLEMVREAVRADPRFEVSTVEIERPGPSYAVDTVKALRGAMPDAELFLIIGADESAEDFAPSVPGGREAVFVPVRRIDVSSTGVRAAVRSGRGAGDAIPPEIAAIIEREGLYSAS